MKKQLQETVVVTTGNADTKFYIDPLTVRLLDQALEHLGSTNNFNVNRSSGKPFIGMFNDICRRD